MRVGDRVELKEGSRILLEDGDMWVSKVSGTISKINRSGITVVFNFTDSRPRFFPSYREVEIQNYRLDLIKIIPKKIILV